MSSTVACACHMRSSMVYFCGHVRIPGRESGTLKVLLLRKLWLLRLVIFLVISLTGTLRPSGSLSSSGIMGLLAV